MVPAPPLPFHFPEQRPGLLSRVLLHALRPVPALCQRLNSPRPRPLPARPQILEESIPSLILPSPRARTARAAAALLGELIEQVGSGEGFGVLFSDMKEAW